MKQNEPGGTPPDPKTNPLLAYSLQGRSAELDAMAVDQKPLLGNICLAGQGTVFCAPPNAGKTLITLGLIIEGVESGRLKGEDIFYVNADDTTQGIAEKVRVMDEYGVHMLAQGYRDFRAPALIGMIEYMIAEDLARDKVLIIDTFKKFTQPMNKADTSAFTDVIRRFVLKGGTLLCLSHTNKNPGADGKNVFAGVNDILDDLDSVYVIDVKTDHDSDRRIAIFTNKKRRGNSPDTAIYSYAAAPSISYLDRLASLREDADQYADYGEPTESVSENEDILEQLGLFIRLSPDAGKMEIIRFIAKANGVSKRLVLRLLEANTGDDPTQHKWRYVLKARGRHAFDLLHKTDS
jgi:AAA domain